MAKAERRRCATYTRKSSEEGLEQDFNSLDAQREACEAYIRSQAGEGWTPVRTRYDDGGYSGGKLDRPGLTQLLADIEAGKIDTVVVYKVDRLTRSLADFAKIVEIFDAHEVSFVSVTQQFNTTTSMGRLTLNMLLSFAQFEREVTGERIRDKIAASKRKGLWMGGPIPLGYEPDGRTLVINEMEAETVRAIYQLYLELGSVRAVKEEADRRGYRSKLRKGSKNRTWGGQQLARGYIHHLLSNPLYAGRIPHHGESYAGQHPAIIDRETWNAVQNRLTAQAPPSAAKSRGSRSSPRRGKLFDEAGELLTPSHTAKAGRRYHYYVSRESGSALPRWRLPAREIERFLEASVQTLLADELALSSYVQNQGIRGERLATLLERARSWHGEPLDRVERVDFGEAQVAIHIDLSVLISSGRVIIQHYIPTQLRRRGVETRLVIQGDAIEARLDPSLIKAAVRARQWFDRLTSGRAASLNEIARAEGVSDRYVGHVIPLPSSHPASLRGYSPGPSLPISRPRR